MKQNDGSKHRLSSAGLYLVGKSALKRCVRSHLRIFPMALHWYECIRNFWLTGYVSTHFRFQKHIPIFFHAMDQNAKPPEDMELSAGCLGSDMKLCDMNYPRLRWLQPHLISFLSLVVCPTQCFLCILPLGSTWLNYNWPLNSFLRPPTW